MTTTPDTLELRRKAEAAMIDRELAHIRAMWASVYRKGIIAGLLERAGRPHDPMPAHYGVRAAKNWSEGFERGLFDDLRRAGERAPTTLADEGRDAG